MTETETRGNGAPDAFGQKLAELKDKHGEVYKLKHAGVTVICRLPTEDEYDRWKDELEKERGKKPVTATERIFRQTCLYPEKADLSAILEKKRGLALTFGNAILELAGIGEGCSVEKA